jgi:hypothetical protein
MGGPLMISPKTLRQRFQAAAETLWPPLYVDPVQPFWRRLRVAYAAVWEPSSATFTQRVRYGLLRGWAGMHNTDLPAPFPKWSAGFFLFWRRLKLSYRAFRSFHGSGIPPVQLYENEDAYRSRMQAINERNRAILRRIEMRHRNRR